MKSNGLRLNGAEPLTPKSEIHTDRFSVRFEALVRTHDDPEKWIITELVLVS